MSDPRIKESNNREASEENRLAQNFKTEAKEPVVRVVPAPVPTPTK